MSGPEIDFHCPKHGTFCEQDHCTDCRYEDRIAEKDAEIAKLQKDLNAALCKASEREQESGLAKCRQKIIFQLTLIAKLRAETAKLRAMTGRLLEDGE